MSVKVAINGFGRIGRMVLRSVIENNRKDIEIVAINNRGNNEVSSFLLKHDTVHGELKTKISYTEKSTEINGKKIDYLPAGIDDQLKVKPIYKHSEFSFK